MECEDMHGIMIGHKRISNSMEVALELSLTALRALLAALHSSHRAWAETTVYLHRYFMTSEKRRSMKHSGGKQRSETMHLPSAPQDVIAVRKNIVKLHMLCATG